MVDRAGAWAGGDARTIKGPLCEDCGRLSKNYGTAAERKIRWCGGCAQAHGGTLRRNWPKSTVELSPPGTVFGPPSDGEINRPEPDESSFGVQRRGRANMRFNREAGMQSDGSLMTIILATGTAAPIVRMAPPRPAASPCRDLDQDQDEAEEDEEVSELTRPDQAAGDDDSACTEVKRPSVQGPRGCCISPVVLVTPRTGGAPAGHGPSDVTQGVEQSVIPSPLSGKAPAAVQSSLSFDDCNDDARATIHRNAAGGGGPSASSGKRKRFFDDVRPHSCCSTSAPLERFLTRARVLPSIEMVPLRHHDRPQAAAPDREQPRQHEEEEDQDVPTPPIKGR